MSGSPTMHAGMHTHTPQFIYTLAIHNFLTCKSVDILLIYPLAPRLEVKEEETIKMPVSQLGETQ